MDELQGDRTEFGFGQPLQALDQAEELVEIGLQDGDSVTGIPVLREVLQLGDQQAVAGRPTARAS